MFRVSMVWLTFLVACADVPDSAIYTASPACEGVERSALFDADELQVRVFYAPEGGAADGAQLSHQSLVQGGWDSEGSKYYPLSCAILNDGELDCVPSGDVCTYRAGDESCEAADEALDGVTGITVRAPAVDEFDHTILLEFGESAFCFGGLYEAK